MRFLDGTSDEVVIEWEQSNKGRIRSLFSHRNSLIVVTNDYTIYKIPTPSSLITLGDSDLSPFKVLTGFTATLYSQFVDYNNGFVYIFSNNEGYQPVLLKAVNCDTGEEIELINTTNTQYLMNVHQQRGGSR